MYHLNPAVIKSFLSQFPKEKFILHARFIRFQAFISAPGSNRRAMFFSMYKWCRYFYVRKFK
jgi:hypothetical protein